ncbi:MAG: hypothetical protein Q7S26_03165 [bacterium]|nr:hypothetical protein [bacterium]
MTRQISKEEYTRYLRHFGQKCFGEEMEWPGVSMLDCPFIDPMGRAAFAAFFLSDEVLSGLAEIAYDDFCQNLSRTRPLMDKIVRKYLAEDRSG